MLRVQALSVSPKEIERLTLMKTVMRHRHLCVIAVAVIMCQAALGAESGAATVRPHHTLRLTLNEFSILNVSEMDGLMKYGGSGDFQLRMAKEGNEVIWIVTIDNPRLAELLPVFVAEKTVKLLQSLDVQNISPDQKIALEAVKSLTQKLEFAQKNPSWDSIRLAGSVEKTEKGLFLKTEDETVQLTGSQLGAIGQQAGKSIIAEGMVKLPGELEVSRYIEKRENTLEIFVMSLCPFGKAATSSLVEHLAQTQFSPVPSLEIHYLFYKQEKDGKATFTSLHGEEEILENLVQIVIRDSFPEFYIAYLLHRAEDGKSSWTEVVRKVGGSEADAQNIANRIKGERDVLIRKEYDYAASRYGITDKSPSFVWEGEPVSNLRKIPAFRNFDLASKGACAH